MPYCSNCGTSVSEDTLFCPHCGQRVGVVLRVQQQYFSQPLERQHIRRIKPNSNMALAILTTVLCCVPLGVYAIILANRVDTLYYEGEYEKAEMTAQDVKKWSIVGMVVSAIAIFIYFVVLIIALISSN